MANAQANVVSTAYVVEVTPGTTPEAALTYLRCNSPDFNANVSTTTSQELRSDRNVTDLVRTSATSEGSVGFELSAVEYEPFIESALGGAFSTAINMSVITISAVASDNSINDSGAGFSTANILPGHFIRIGGFTTPGNNGVAKVVSVTTSKIVVSRLTLADEAAGNTVTVKGKSVRNAATKKTFTIERHFTDLTTTFQSHVGMLVNQMNLNVASEAIIDGSFSFMGRATQFTTSTVGTGAATAATSNPIMSATANVGSLYENDALVSGVFFKSINLTTNNNARSLTAISNLYPVDINMGTFDAEFAVEAYFSSKTLLEKYLNGDVTEISYSLTDDNGNTFVVDAPEVKFTAGSLTGVTLNSDVMQSLTAKALYDATLGYSLQISYLPA